MDELTGVVGSSGEPDTFKEDFEEYLRVEGEGRRVERNGLDGGVDVIGPGDGVGHKQGDYVLRREVSTISHTSEDLVERVLGLWDQPIRSRGSRVRTAEQEFQARSTGAVGDTDCCGELDQVSSGDCMSAEEWCEDTYCVGDAEVGVEVGLDVGEDDWGAIGTSTSWETLGQEFRGECDGVVCGEEC